LCKFCIVAAIALIALASDSTTRAETVALWLFDEQEGLYPSCALGDASGNDYPLVLGKGGQLLPGKFGRALEPLEQPKIDLTTADRYTGFERRPAVDPSRTMPPMDWSNADFCALMTRGEKHLRSEVGFASATRTRLNLGNFDWTVEFWYLPTQKAADEAVVFEVGEGPRGENDRVTQLVLNSADGSFTLGNQPSGVRLNIPSDRQALSSDAPEWHHLAFIYDAASGQLRHYVDGKLQPLPEKCVLKPLPDGDEDYCSIGRDARWERPLPGRIDELRVSDGQIYHSAFEPPQSFSKYNRPDYNPYDLQAGPPLLFEKGRRDGVVRLGGRKYVFIDDALLADSEKVTFTVNPPRFAERVFEGGHTHLTVNDDNEGNVRIYYRDRAGRLMVITSRDGVHFKKPDLGPSRFGERNVVIDEPVGMGTVFVDPSAPADERYKYLSGYEGRAIFVYTSPDGYRFRRNETSALPFRAASQSVAYYDDQRQKYVAFHRTDMPETVAGKTERASVRTETTDVMRPWPFTPLSQAEQREIAQRRRIGKKLPWYLDNGPLTPGGFGVEFPIGLAPEDSLDPVGTDIYVPKCVKYAWAPDTYLAFPIMYFHYDGDGPPTRQVLGERQRKRGSGPLETQIAASRDGIHWKRYPRPPYIKIGRHDGFDIHKNYIAHGMVRREDEIWQYYFGSEQYHSSWQREGREAIFRVVQRLDGFISADTPYTGGGMKTRPLVFDGKRLVLNIDTGATGYAQVGILDENGQPFEGFGIDDCVFINGDYIDTEVEWLRKGTDVTSLSGKAVQLVVRSRGTKLYSLQFVDR
jgi:Concanavalin A-like lectin/glucanases superfamily